MNTIKVTLIDCSHFGIPQFEIVLYVLKSENMENMENNKITK